MAGEPTPPRRNPMIVVFGLLAASAALAWLIAGLEGCRHAGLF